MRFWKSTLALVQEKNKHFYFWMGNPVDLESKEPAVVVQNKNNDDPRRRQVVDLGEFLFHKFQKAVQYFVVKCR